VTSLEASFAIARDERDCIGVRRRHALDDQLGEPVGEITPTLLLPARYECPRTVVVDERRTSLCEGEATPDALDAPFDRPGPGRTAAGAPGRPDPNEHAPTPFAESRPRQSADTAARWQQDRERRHSPTVRPDLSRRRDRFVPEV
jgi:hypothetical protein